MGRIGCPETSVCYYETTLRIAGGPISVASVLSAIQEIFCSFGDSVVEGWRGDRWNFYLTNIPFINDIYIASVTNGRNYGELIK